MSFVGIARSMASGSPLDPEPNRNETMTPIGSSLSRRKANDRTEAEGVSIHCTSSIAMISGPDEASARSTPTDAIDTAR